MVSGNRLHVSAAILLVVAFTLLVSLSGCAIGKAISTPLPAKNIERWVNPLDSYVPMKSVASDYAEVLLNAKCMTAAGYDWQVPWRDLKGDNGPSWNSVDRRLFNVSLASKYGYHDGPPERSSTNPEWEAFAHKKISPAEDAALTRCIEHDRKRLPTLDGATANLAMGYIGAAIDNAIQDGGVLTAMKKWKACMTPVGIVDLPDSPLRMPTESIRTRFGIDLSESASTGTASAEEITIAVADAACQDSSGFSKAFYNAEWDASVVLYKENADALAVAREAIEQHDAAVEAIIDANMP